MKYDGKNCLILILSGHEVRQFGHSGLIDLMIREGWNVHILTRVDDPELKIQLNKKVSIQQLFKYKLPRNFVRLQTMLDKVEELRQLKLETTIWVDQVRTTNRHHLKWYIKLLASIINIPLFYSTLSNFERIYSERIKVDEQISYLRSNQIHAVITNAPRSETLLPILLAARKLNIPSFLFYHSIKDISARMRLNFPFTAIGVWNEWMKKTLIESRKIQTGIGSIFITGCGHFDLMLNKSQVIDKNEMLRSLNLPQNSRIILYLGALDFVLPKQYKYLEQMILAINENELADNTYIIIRDNPMNKSKIFPDEIIRNNHIRYLEANWKFDEINGMNIQKSSDLLEYNSLLNLSDVMVSLPSTASIEASLWNLPVLNLNYELDSAPPPKPINEFWKADFNQEVIELGLVEKILTSEHLIERLNFHLSNQEIIDKRKAVEGIIGGFDRMASEKYISVINRILKLGTSID